MKYELDTMPVWDALKADSECPFCLLEKRSRLGAIRYYLGPSVMVPEVRLEVNKIGFNSSNARLLSKDPNKLGLALITHTRLETLLKSFEKNSHSIQKNVSKALPKLIDFLKEEEDSCLIEEKIENDLQRFLYTFFYLWKNDIDFKNKWNASKGACLPHSRLILENCEKWLKSQDLDSFVSEFIQLIQKNLHRVETDVLSFTQTFDATQSHELLGNPDKALDRSLIKIYGQFPEYEEEGRIRKGPLLGS